MEGSFMKIFTVTMVILMLVALPSYGEAYVGPGLGLGVIGAVIGVIVAVFLAFVGMLWYPIKRFFLKNSSQGKDADPS
jgi:hypothetical protein